jgi:hypothetical protein
MTIINVPRPPKSAHNPDRSASSLLMSQVEQLHHAEKRLPLRYRTEIYINAIKTERHAAEYIREVTLAIQEAHKDAAVRQAKSARKQRGLPKLSTKTSSASTSRKGVSSGKGTKKTSKHKA